MVQQVCSGVSSAPVSRVVTSDDSLLDAQEVTGSSSVSPSCTRRAASSGDPPRTLFCRMVRKRLWEGGVCLGPAIINSGIEHSYQSGFLSPRDYYVRLKESTEVVLDRLGGVLERVDQDI